MPEFPVKEGANRLDSLLNGYSGRTTLWSHAIVVNRYWMRFMGKGIVLTPEDLGTQSDPPTHPELLDWLATSFMGSGWNIKEIQKKIVMSQTYRQSSDPQMKS